LVPRRGRVTAVAARAATEASSEGHADDDEGGEGYATATLHGHRWWVAVSQYFAPSGTRDRSSGTGQ